VPVASQLRPINVLTGMAALGLQRGDLDCTVDLVLTLVSMM
jgi:hypothetical protein